MSISNNSLFVGKVAHRLVSVDSTNAYAKLLFSKSKPTEGTAICAEEQSAGRGQIGSKWEAAPQKNIIMSVILYPKFLLATAQFQLNQVVSLAVLATLSEYIDPQLLHLKWPNDIYIQDKKVGGILIENSLKGTWLDHSIVGIGLNINQTTFGAALTQATSLAIATRQQYDLEILLARLCENIEGYYLQLQAKSSDSKKKLEQAYLDSLLGYQAWRNYQLPQHQTTFRGKITGVSPTGKLQVETEAHPLEFDLKEIKFLFD